MATDLGRPAVGEPPAEHEVGTAGDVTAERIQEFSEGGDETSNVLLESRDREAAAEGIWEWFKAAFLNKKTHKDSSLSAILRPEALDPTASGTLFPRILGDVDEMRMNRADLADEVYVLSGMGSPGSKDQPYIYQINVLEPTDDYTFEGDPESFGGALTGHSARVEVSTGLLTHEVLYGVDEGTREELLRSFLEHARRVKISRQGPAGEHGYLEVSLR